MLQRLTEDFEYSEILNTAAKCSDPCEQLAYVCVFIVSSYSSTSNRTSKPFNPLLGETYECDRENDLGWRFFAEQVSHHPPVAATHCKSSNWTSWQEFTMHTRFKGKFLEVIPQGRGNVIFNGSGYKFTWTKVTTAVHNIIVGKLWVDHFGDMSVVGTHKDKTEAITAKLEFTKYSYFNHKEQRRVKGCVMDGNKQVRYVLMGKWDFKMDIAPVLSITGTPDKPIFETGPVVTVWQRRLPDANCEKYYGFTIFACQLNEMEEGVAPTDSRLRPDQRLMEEGDWDAANAVKVRLEEQQRTVRREREEEEKQKSKMGAQPPTYEPVWFFRRKIKNTNSYEHIFKDTYWKCKEAQNWAACPNIY